VGLGVGDEGQCAAGVRTQVYTKVLNHRLGSRFGHHSPGTRRDCGPGPGERFPATEFTSILGTPSREARGQKKPFYESKV
jgi:hypothetical protein